MIIHKVSMRNDDYKASDLEFYHLNRRLFWIEILLIINTLATCSM